MAEPQNGRVPFPRRARSGSTRGGSAHVEVPARQVIGFVDRFDQHAGIAGWAIDPDRPDEALPVELLLGATVIATTSTGQSRQDVALATGHGDIAGFCFPPAIFPELRRWSPLHDATQLAVRVAGALIAVSVPVAPPTLGALLEAEAPLAPATVGPDTGDDGAQAVLDQLFLVPGFGGVARGWALNPRRRIAGLALWADDSCCVADAGALYFYPRPDLAEITDGRSALLARAGFVAVFQGSLPATGLELEVRYAGGGASRHPVDAATPQLVGHAVDVEALTELYPALTSEPFFPQLACAVLDATRASLTPARAMTVSPAERVLVQVVPEDRSDAALLLEELCHRCRGLPAPPGLVLIAGTGPSRGTVSFLFAELEAESGVPCSLFLLDDTDQALHALPELLRLVGARDFAFAAAGVFLTQAGWASVAGPDAADLRFLQSDDLAEAARGFAWSTQRFAAWAATAAVYLGGYYGDNGLGPADLVAGGARCANVAPSAPLLAAINRAGGHR